jgi:hypothetical protein
VSPSERINEVWVLYNKNRIDILPVKIHTVQAAAFKAHTKTQREIQGKNRVFEDQDPILINRMR